MNTLGAASAPKMSITGRNKNKKKIAENAVS